MVSSNTVEEGTSEQTSGKPTTTTNTTGDTSTHNIPPDDSVAGKLPF